MKNSSKNPLKEATLISILKGTRKKKTWRLPTRSWIAMRMWQLTNLVPQLLNVHNFPNLNQI